MLETIDLVKCYGSHTALNGLNLTVRAGEVFCLLGANGAGKSTTINLFLNFVSPSSGRALVNGLDVVRHPLESKKLLGYIPEQVMLYKDLTGFENLAYFSSLSRRNALSKTELSDLLARVRLAEDTWWRPVATYSKGMRQKVAIAIALAKQAKAFLFDEPTSGLDPKACNEFSELVRQLKEDNVAILMATHDLFRAKETGTQLGIMKHGQLVETLQTESVEYADLEQMYLRHMHD